MHHAFQGEHAMSGDNRTLDEIKADDIGQLEDLLKKAKEYWFTDVRHALQFQGEMLFKELKRHKVNVNEKMDGRMVERQLSKQKMKVENRAYPEEENKWREGIYVYKNDEIIVWISKIEAIKKSILNIYHEYRVKSTIKE